MITTHVFIREMSDFQKVRAQREVSCVDAFYNTDSTIPQLTILSLIF